MKASCYNTCVNRQNATRREISEIISKEWALDSGPPLCKRHSLSLAYKFLLHFLMVMCRQQVNTNTWLKLYLSKRLMCSHEGWLAKYTHTQRTAQLLSNIISFSIAKLLQKEETYCLGESSASTCICAGCSLFGLRALCTLGNPTERCSQKISPHPPTSWILSGNTQRA